MYFHAIIKGRVQGVGFRYWVYQKANELGLKGWVRNRPDRQVEVEAEGDEEDLEKMEQLLWRGPTLSRVDDVKLDYFPGERGYQDFDIKH